MNHSTRTALKRSLLSAVVFSFLPACAFAQGAQTAPNTLLPPIEVSGVPTTQEAVYQTPSAASTVSEGEIDIFGSEKLDNVLRTLPGVFTRDSPNQPGTSVNIRGFEGSGRVTMMIDGVRQNFRFTGHEAQGFLYVDPQLLAGIDVQRGTVIGTGGTGSLAGTANFRTLGVDDILRPGRNFGALNTTTFGTNGTGFMNMIAAAAKVSPNVAFAGAFGFRNSHLYKNGAGVIVPFAGEQELTSGLFKLDLAPTENSTLKFGYVKYDNVFSANSYLQNVQADTFTIKYAYKPANDLIDFKFNVNANNVDMRYIRGLNAFATASNRRIQDRAFGFDTSNVSRFLLGDIHVRSQTGMEYFADKFTTANGGVNPTADTSVLGVFNQTTFSRGIFDLTAGLRYDHYNIQGSGEVLVPGPFVPVGPFNIDRDVGRLNPKVTLAARVTPWFQPFVTYSESMRSPTSFEMFVGGTHPGTPGNSGTSYIPNPTLEPEIQKGVEIGANFVRDGLFTTGDAFRMKTVYFHQNVSNYIVYCSGPSGLPTPPGPASFNWFCNVPGTSQVNGLELQASYDAGYVFAGVSYTYLNNNLPAQTPGFGASQYMPDHNLVVTLGGRFLDKRLTAGLRAYFVSGADDPSYSATAQRPGYELLDLFAEYTVRPGWTVSTTLINAFDKTYTPLLGTPPSSSCVSFIPGGCPPSPDSGRGRTLLVTSKIQF
ncbi:MAG TPA: TonB-dependent receptor [Xanthobacteraceae bacterium]|nr:TonB-dependent receptor [Xanthobacteraceae bacterium]